MLIVINLTNGYVGKIVLFNCSNVMKNVASVTPTVLKEMFPTNHATIHSASNSIMPSACMSGFVT
jgi:hypothetical protein